MSENSERNFFEEFAKWYLIWNIIILIGKVIMFIFKVFIVAIQQLVYLICIGIAKISPILKEKFEIIRNNYNTNYKFQLEEKLQELKTDFSNIKNRCKNSFSEFKVKIQNRKNMELSKISTAKTTLSIKKLKYNIIEFIYKNELQIIVIAIILIIILIILCWMFSNFSY